MRIGLIGSVDSSLRVLTDLIAHRMDVVAVWGYEPDSVKNISGYQDLSWISAQAKIPYHSFVKVNDNQVKEQVRSAGLDLLFVVGLSQLVDTDLLKIPRYGCVGFHPTRLPQGRGRAPLAWLVLERMGGAATFFKLTAEADNGEIYAQELFEVSEDDDAESVVQKILAAIDVALDDWLPLLKAGFLQGVPQEECVATSYGRRAPLDGCIDWSDSAYRIDRLVKATTSPHPGAFSFYGDYRVVLWKTHCHENGFPKGVIGRVVSYKDGNPVVQAGEGYVEIVRYEMLDAEGIVVDLSLVIGSRLGYYDQYEIFKLRNEIKEIKRYLEERDGKQGKE